MFAVCHCRALAFEGKEISARANDLIASRFERFDILKSRMGKGAECLVVLLEGPFPLRVLQRIVDYDDLCSAEDREAARAVFASTSTPDEKAGQDWESTTIGRKMIIGAVDVSRHEFELSALALREFGDSSCYIADMAVHPAFHGLGVGDYLLKEAVRRAEHKHGTRIFLHVDESNKPAIRLYERNGFRRVPDSEPARSNDERTRMV